MIQNIRFKEEEQMKISKKLKELNRALVSLDEDTISATEMMHELINKGLDTAYIENDGKLGFRG